mmetsp:Transcript_23838/g.66597  ORF Transcript_23838/g.66597 Transcript_23838/m.66597 type:complete len:202 (-) Transcript_23838:1242-1847(-)|eukprot:CAMPEP_0198111412 /NCGR_PEP_ID=MMETSP1442-20131203/3367_1 /TAXON_ID= /ORGANISM="Craspedostauros australis, Strain CCMP3328" /LENGTH=201 /DNA_ID=CAMNT_0043767827 /DNA_START=458 /DNA_END=1063 /DNA_ORIENTATION=-
MKFHIIELAMAMTISLTSTVDAFSVLPQQQATSPSLQQPSPTSSFTALMASSDDKEWSSFGTSSTLERPKEVAATTPATTTNGVAAAAVAEEETKELSKTEQMMQQVKDAGLAGVISYAIWELGFWAISVPVCALGYYQVTGHWPDLTNSDDQAKLGAEAFAFVNFARFAVPLRIGLALSTTPWMQTNVVDKFLTKDEDKQ